MYRKIHITPNEVFHWELQEEHHSNFDTDCGKIGIVICYDVEFPELSRLMADEGMNIYCLLLNRYKTVIPSKTLCKQSN
jgi:predicted amidohydrolase